MKIGEVARRTGLSIDTLRYYEKLGLIDPPWRQGGQRAYDENIIAWLKFIRLLKATGMPLADVETYARLRRDGERSSVQRREMLEHQRMVVLAKIDELKACVELLDHKIMNYAEIEMRHRAEDGLKEQTYDH
ncbi:MerR family transcriptional regulator [Nitratireductor kimnyeongensis]|uniref:MerR family transcriptional regulator n=1 Tax=Nitratireductor kimnyeongensis TaxID=430679 RepID=A0ABW0T7B7_9HYPH|nr:MerR family transcriptional regulator [Nitratireductor kimnyeongensis]QZZ34664.1 MerR family transcriptional regulator [Nitratireductor kimnyeongensis]